MRYDVVIIGSGPAGAHLGFLLAKAGLKTALVDRQPFPRDKLCGGLLTSKTLQLLKKTYPDWMISDAMVKSAHTFYKKALAGSFQMISPMHVVRRYDFDMWLVSAACQKGCDSFFGNGLINLDPLQRKVILRDGTTLTYGCLFGADGVKSIVRRLLGLPKNSSGFCMETYLPRESIRQPKRLEKKGIEIYYGDNFKGYGWLFPGKDYVAVGVGDLTAEISEREIITQYYTFLKTVSYDCDILSRGAYLPSGNSILLGSSQEPDICLLGDAAGLIDPFTGEGIYYALVSAEMAAQAVLSGKSIYPEYSLRMQESMDAITDTLSIRDYLYQPAILQNGLSTMQALPQYSEQLIDKTIATYSKSYREAYQELLLLSR